MATVNPNADPTRRSAWRALLPILLFGLIVLASAGMRLSTGDQGTSAVVMQGGLGILALWAVVDGIRRGFGRSTFLGTGRGLDRLFGFAQVAISLSVAVALLPNTLAFVEFVTGVITGR
jgi:hypothetical protein